MGGERSEVGDQPLAFRRLGAGRRLRVALAGADRETFARVPAAGTPVWLVGRNAARPSGIRLPVVGG